MLNIEIVYLGKLDKRWQDLKEHYLKILRPFVVLEFRELKAEKFNEKNQKSIIANESKKIDDFLKKKKFANIYLLSEKGKCFNSLELADFLHSFDASKLTLVIGGALGFSEDLKTKYKKISLSALTFPHQMSQIILLEQIYRSVTISKNKNYHY